jgi:hypothetical protein
MLGRLTLFSGHCEMAGANPRLRNAEPERIHIRAGRMAFDRPGEHRLAIGPATENDYQLQSLGA